MQETPEFLHKNKTISIAQAVDLKNTDEFSSIMQYLLRILLLTRVCVSVCRKDQNFENGKKKKKNQN
jgi:hypothetical protein